MATEAIMHPRSTDRTLLSITAALATTLAACSDYPTATPETGSVSAQRASKKLACAPNNAGLVLPPGFCAVVVADLTHVVNVGGVPQVRAAPARHMAVTPSGDVFVAINAGGNNQPPHGIVALRDRDGDGRADQEARFSPGLGGSGLTWGQSRLYFGANDRVLRFTLPAGQLTPQGAPETVVSGLVATGDHISKTVVLDGPHTLFVNIGSATNSCQVRNRQPGIPGDGPPCRELAIRAGVWRFDARGTNQTQDDGERWATGVRNGVALAMNPADGELYGVPHGRDQLFEHWGDPAFFPHKPGFSYTQKDDAFLPSEELVRLARGSDVGWPYCYFDDRTDVPERATNPAFRGKVIAPEYGGDGDLVRGGRHNLDCSAKTQPLVNFGAHWAPNGMVFYTGNQFPERYRGGAFVAFHGGFDRTPFPNEGYQVAFVPVDGNGMITGEWETFADNFTQAPPGAPLPASARHRPVGVTEGPDGSLYVSDDRGGRIFRIVYTGR
jgi:glucose/arabinose dehydrogenase